MYWNKYYLRHSDLLPSTQHLLNYFTILISFSDHLYSQQHANCFVSNTNSIYYYFLFSNTISRFNEIGFQHLKIYQSHFIQFFEYWCVNLSNSLEMWHLIHVFKYLTHWVCLYTLPCCGCFRMRKYFLYGFRLTILFCGLWQCFEIVDFRIS